MPHRILKQFAYGLFYLIFFALLVAGVYFAFFRPAPSCFDNKLNQSEEAIDCGGPCIPCAAKNALPLKVFLPQIFPADGGRATVLLQFKNLNSAYAAKNFLYDLDLYDSAGETVFHYRDISFAYADYTATIILPAIEADFSAIARAEVAPRDFEWVPAANFSEPQIKAENIATTPGKDRAVVAGILVNQSPFVLRKVEVGALAVSRSGIFLNASRTIVDEVKPFSSTQFSVFIPLKPADLKEINPAATKVFVSATR